MATLAFLESQVTEAEKRVSEIGERIKALKSKYVMTTPQGDLLQGIGRADFDALMLPLQRELDAARHTFRTAQSRWSNAK